MGKPSTSIATRPQLIAADRRRRPGRDVRPEAVLPLRMAQTGDRDAPADLYRTFAGNVRRYVAARMRHRDPDAVADLVDDIFAGALTELDRAHAGVDGAAASADHCR
jgi:hypothetical protein